MLPSNDVAILNIGAELFILLAANLLKSWFQSVRLPHPIESLWRTTNPIYSSFKQMVLVCDLSFMYIANRLIFNKSDDLYMKFKWVWRFLQFDASLRKKYTLWSRIYARFKKNSKQWDGHRTYDTAPLSGAHSFDTRSLKTRASFQETLSFEPRKIVKASPRKGDWLWLFSTALSVFVLLVEKK